jgi:hypothetical protein
MKKIFKSIISTSTILMVAFSPFVALTPTVSAADTGFNSPSAQSADTGGDGNGFELNPTNAFSNDSDYASNINGAGDRHRFYNYNFNLPSNAIINGIEVRLDWWLDSNQNSNSMDVQLSWDGGTSWTSPPKTNSAESTYDTNNKILGSPTDTWGRTWSVSDFDNSNFRVRVTSNSNNSQRDFYLDWVGVKVYYTEAVPNPQLSQSCGLDIALVIDSSGSIDNTELGQMKDAFETFVDAFLPETPTQFSVTDFDDTATVLQDFTSDTSLINTAINTPTSDGYTNWEQGLIEAQSTFDPRPNPNLIIFASDGNPNRIGKPPVQVSETVALNVAIVVANALKSSGTRILTLGIGNDLDINNLKAISGPNVNTGTSSDVITTNFSTLAADLANLANDLCGGTITVTKYVDQTLTDGWTFMIGDETHITGEVGGGVGQTQAVYVLNGTYSVSETPQAGYSLIDAFCSGANNNGTSSGNTISGIEVETDNIVSCVFNNSLECIPSDEICDGVDNDCDGYIDEDILPTPTICGVGACASVGELTCYQGIPTDTCQPGTPSPESCDNVDNDCDGAVDEELTNPTTCGYGVCSGNTGYETCTAGVWGGDTCDPYYGAGTEVCEGQLDEDCDGTIDDGCACVNGNTDSCGQTDEGECSMGTKTCIDGAWGECEGAVGPTDELCDDLDNDCDGSVDEDFTNKGQVCSVGQGICQATGQYVCTQDGCGTECNAIAGETSPEICDQLDNDCDGQVDEDGVCTTPVVTIYASKIVCQAEADLPNWGNGGPDITSTTAQDFVNGNQNCQLASGWDFEWAYASAQNPGDNIIGPVGSPWTTFGPTDGNGLVITNINSLSGDRIWVREVMKEGYIPFSGDTTAPRDNVSAELYCHQDVLNYDNYDYILNPQLDTTYYCVGFNVPTAEPEPTGTVSGHKYNDLNQNGAWDEGEPGLGGWNIWIDFDKDGIEDYEDWQTTSDGDNNGLYRFTLVPVGNYNVCEILDDNHPGWATKNDLCQPITVTENETSVADFFNYEINTGSLTICKYEDKGTIGQYEEGTDTPLAWDMTVLYPDQETLYTRTNGETGCVTISGLPFGEYLITEATQANWVRSYPAESDTQTANINIEIQNPSVYFLNYYQEPQPYCGDETCNGSETCSTCPGDCGSCGGGGGGGGDAPLFLYIYDENIASVGIDNVIINWLTNIPADSRLVYTDTTHTYDSLNPPNYGYSNSNAVDPIYTTSHMMVLTGLLSGTTYYLRGISWNGGDSAISEELTFTTLGVAGVSTTTIPEISITILPPEEGQVAGAATETEEVTTPSVQPEVAGEETIVPEEAAAAVGGFAAGTALCWILFIITIILNLWHLWLRRKGVENKNRRWVLPLFIVVLLILYYFICCAGCVTCCLKFWVLMVINTILFVLSLFIKKKQA